MATVRDEGNVAVRPGRTRVGIAREEMHVASAETDGLVSAHSPISYMPTGLVLSDGSSRAVSGDAPKSPSRARYFGCPLLGGDVLDLMSSWTSHFRTPPTRLVLLGMNAVELRANAMAAAAVVYDLNANPFLPFADQSFDAVCATRQSTT